MLNPSLTRASVGSIVCLLLVGCVAASKTPASGKVVAFVGVNVVPMDAARVEIDQTVVVRDGLIVEIDRASQVEVPTDAHVIDGSGKYLMPGLADMHVHLDGEDPGMLSVFLANGVTTVRNMWGSPEILQWRKQIEEVRLVGPRIFTTGPILDGKPLFWPGSTAIQTAEEAAKEVAAEKRMGYDAIKVFAGLSPLAYQGVLSAAREHQLPVYGHVPVRVGLVNALSGGQKSFEHMDDFIQALLSEDSPVRADLVEAWTDRSKATMEKLFIGAYTHADPAGIVSLADKVAAAGVWFCPTLVVHAKLALSPEEFEALLSSSAMEYVAAATHQEWTSLATVFAADEAGWKQGLGIMLRSVGAMHAAGVPMLIGTDTPNPFVVPGFSVHEALENFVKSGLTPFEALAAATRDAAVFLESSDEFGTVQVGKRADLILVKGNPLDDVHNASELAGVMASGHWFSENELDSMLEAVARNYREAGTTDSTPEGEDE